MTREFLQKLRVGEEVLPKDVIDAIMEENGKDAQAAKLWQEKYNRAQSEHEAALKGAALETRVDRAILAAKGRNLKAIRALLDMEALGQGDDKALQEALEAVKQQCDYLFEQPQTPPPYAGGTGVQSGAASAAPVTLAGALRERFKQGRA